MVKSHEVKGNLINLPHILSFTSEPNRSLAATHSKKETSLTTGFLSKWMNYCYIIREILLSI